MKPELEVFPNERGRRVDGQHVLASLAEGQRPSPPRT